MSTVEKSVLLKKLIKESVVEALADKDVLFSIIQKVIEYSAEQQLKIMETMKKDIVKELVGQMKLVESQPQTQRRVSRPGGNPEVEEDAPPNAVIKERMKKVNNIATKVFGGVNPLANITEAQVEQLPQYRQNEKGQYEEIEAVDQGLNIKPLAGMFKGQFQEEPEVMVQEAQSPSPKNRQSQPKPTQTKFKTPSIEQIRNLESRRKQDFYTADTMAPMASSAGLIDFNEVDMGDNAMYGNMSGGIDNGMGGNMSYEEDYLPDFSSLRADPSEFTDPV
jgi:hypothetical protein